MMEHETGSPTVAPVADGASTLGVVSGATMLVLIIFTVPLTTLEPTAMALSANAGVQAWIMSAMPLGAAIGLLVSGVLGDGYGRRRVFLLGLVVMMLASAAGALAGSGLALILARVVQGLGGAAVLACGLGLLGAAYRDAQSRAAAATVWAAGLGAGVAIGPILAAFLTGLGGWTASYWCDAGLAAVFLLAGSRHLPETGRGNGGAIDWGGALLLMAGLAMFLAGLTEFRLGWDRPLVWGLLGGGSALVAGFLFLESRLLSPLLDLSLFGDAAFTGATFAAFASGAGILSLMSLVPMIAGRLLAMPALHAAFLLCAWSATSVVTALSARWLPARITPRKVLISGLGTCTIAQLLLVSLPPEGALPRMIGALLLAGAANGFLNSALGRLAVSTVPLERAAMGSGANNTARYLGSAIGITLGAVLIAHGGEAGDPAGLIRGWNEAVLVTAGMSLLGTVVASVTRR